jgi:hypothetical protein
MGDTDSLRNKMNWNARFSDRGQHIQRALRKIDEIHGNEAINVLANYPRRVSGTRIIELSNMWHERSYFILNSIFHGSSITGAFIESGQLYDTHGWREINSRLYRSRGLVLRALLAVLWQNDHLDDEYIDRIELLGIVSSASELAARCLQLIERFPIQSESTGTLPQSSGALRAELDPRAEDLYDARSNLSRTVGFIQKCVRDIPLMPEKIAIAPTLSQRARANVDIARMAQGLSLLRTVLISESLMSTSSCQQVADHWGIGLPYSAWLGPLEQYVPFTRRIATHQKPDGDALVATWLLDRFLFTADRVQVEFLPRNYVVTDDHHFDCVVDVGRSWNPELLHFDPKPRAFRHRDKTCATRLVWEELRRRGCQIEHLAELVDVVHDGDAASRLSKSQAYKESRKYGLHAQIKNVGRWAESAGILYHSIAMWLDGCFGISRVGSGHSD